MSERDGEGNEDEEEHGDNAGEDDLDDTLKSRASV